MRPVESLSLLITGGGSGLGAGAARYFADRGARVTIAGRRADKIAAVAAEAGPSVLAIEGDVTRADDRRRMIEAALSHGGKLDALLNNAGNMYRGPIEALDESKLLELFHSNVVAGMQLTGLAVPHLERTAGAVVFLGSIHTRRAFPGASPYAATKGAVEALTRVLAAELGSRKIRVNCVVPGAVPTEINQRAGLFDDAAALARLEAMAPLHALKRIGTPKEIAEAIDYLVRADWTTGISLVVDGGLALGLTGHEPA